MNSVYFFIPRNLYEVADIFNGVESWNFYFILEASIFDPKLYCSVNNNDNDDDHNDDNNNNNYDATANYNNNYM